MATKNLAFRRLYAELDKAVAVRLRKARWNLGMKSPNAK